MGAAFARGRRWSGPLFLLDADHVFLSSDDRKGAAVTRTVRMSAFAGVLTVLLGTVAIAVATADSTLLADTEATSIGSTATGR